MDRNKKTRRNTIITLAIGLPIYTFIFLMLFFNHERGANWHIDMLVDLLCLSLIPIAVIVLMIIIPICVDGARYKSIEDEVNDEKSENPETAHDVLAILKDDEKETFVLAYYYLDDMIRPAVYNKYGKRITSIDLHTSLFSYQKIYPLANIRNREANVRIMRIRNKHTKKQMIFFATKLANANILFNGRTPERFECDALGDFSMFGCEYNEEDKHEVVINGVTYPLRETLVDFMFISKIETV